MGTLRAVKIVHRENFSQDRPFAREYEGLLKYEPISRSHPNLMQILHVGRRDDCFYYVTELADDAGLTPGSVRRTEDPPAEPLGNEGPAAHQTERAAAAYVPRTLQEELDRRGRILVRECVPLATALAAALQYLHAHGLVHRDVKPSNVIFVHGVPKLADIGLVSAAGNTGSIVGTEGYLPPEGPGSPQADLYALGKLLYEISTGLSRTEYPRLPHNLRQLPDAAALLEFNEVLLRACARETHRRYARADELLADLALLERGASVRRLRRLERHLALLKRIGIAALAIGLLVSMALWQSWRAHRVARHQLAQLHVNEGTQRMIRGDEAAALPWLVGALQLDDGHPTHQQAHHTRIARVLEHCPLPSARFSAPATRVMAADQSLDSRWIATAHEDGGVRLWETASGACLRTLPHEFPVLRCEFTPSGDQLLTITAGQQAILWDLTHPDRSPLRLDQAVGFASDGYSVGLNQTLGRAYLAKGARRFARVQELTPLSEHFTNLTLGLKLAGQGDILTIQYAVRQRGPEGRIFCQGELRDTPATDPFDFGHDHPPGPTWGRAFLMLENASVADVPNARGRLVWDNLKMRRYPSNENPTAWRLIDDFSDPTLDRWISAAPKDSSNRYEVQDGRLVMSSDNLPRTHYGWSGALRLEWLDIDAAHTTEIEVDLLSADAPHPQAALTLARPVLHRMTVPDRPFLLAGRSLVLTWWDRTVRRWDLEQQRFVAMEGHGPAIHALQTGSFADPFSVSPDGKHLAYAQNEEGSIWDLDSGRKRFLKALAPIRTTGAQFSPDNRFLVVTHAQGLTLIRTTDGQQAATLGSGSSSRLPCCSARGSRVAAVADTGSVLAWDLGDLEDPPAVFPHAFSINRLTFSPDGRYLAASSADGFVRIWDVLRREPFGPPLPGWLVRFSPDGTDLLLLGSTDAWLWNLSRVRMTPQLVPPLCGDHTSATASDGTLTAEIAGREILIRTRQTRYALAGQNSLPWRRLAFSLDGRHLIAENSDLHIWTWDLPTRTLIEPPTPARYDPTLSHPAPLPATVDPLDQESLADMAAFLGGQRPDGEGGMLSVDEPERGRLLDRLRRNHVLPTSPDAATRQRWHRDQAEAAEHAMDWEAAVFHWERPAPLSPHNRHAHRLAYAQHAASLVSQAIREGRSRWSVILPRQPWASADMLDLGTSYNLPLGEPLAGETPGASFRALSSGVQLLGGVPFDARGAIRLGRANPVLIPVGRACRRIHFLHASGQRVGRQGLREPVARFEVTYDTGEKAVINPMNPDDVPPYDDARFFESVGMAWAGTAPGLRSALAWTAASPNPAFPRPLLYLTRTTWDLPAEHQHRTVRSLALQASSNAATLLVFAITAEGAP